MNYLDGFRKVMRGEPSDFIPNWELGCWGQTIERWRREGMPVDRARTGDMNMFEGDDFLGLDRRAFANLNTGMIPGFAYEVLEETDRYVVQRHANGIVSKALKEGAARGTRMSMDQYLSHPVTDRRSWADVRRRYDPSAPVRYPFWWDEQARLWKDRGYPVCLLPNASFGLYSQLRSWCGTEGISYLFYDDPALVEEMIEFNAEFLLALVGRALEDVRFDYFNFFEDCAGKGGPLYGPGLFRRFFEKPYRRIIERMRRSGIGSFWLDCDGHPGPLIPLWMDVGITALWPLEQAAGMDPRELRRLYPRLVLLGGIDKRELAKGRAAIEAELTAKIPPLLDRGGFVPHVDHTVPPDVSWDDFLYYMDLKRRLMGR